MVVGVALAVKMRTNKHVELGGRFQCTFYLVNMLPELEYHSNTF